MSSLRPIAYWNAYHLFCFLFVLFIGSFFGFVGVLGGSLHSSLSGLAWPLRAVIEDDAPSATRELSAATVVQTEALLALIVRPLTSDADRLMGLAKAASDNITIAG